MAYQALYRKWRPVDFDSVCGQQHIVSLLKDEVAKNRVSHAYLLCGTRGTGKTTIAKILAKAVNCTNSKDGNPCNECESCKAVNNGSSIDVVEIDAASNNGVDNIRDIREQVVYAPTSCKYKVYIIDEVHMLSTGAFNALLKTLEEPPEHVIFILATTEFAKVPATILSRCQRFDFKKIPLSVIQQRIEQVCEGEGVTIEKSACELIARLADGALRDALSILDQCISAGDSVTYENVAQLTGVGSRQYLEDMVSAITQSDYSKAIAVSESLRESSKSYETATQEMLGFFRDMLLIKTIDSYEELLNCTLSEIPVAKSFAQTLTSGQIIGYVDIIQNEYDRIVRGGGTRVDFEILLYKLCRPSVCGDVSALTDRIERLENALSGGSVAPQPKQVKKETKAEPKPEPKPKEKPVMAGNLWNEIKTKFEPSVAVTLNSADVTQTDDGFVIGADGIYYNLLTQSDAIVNQIKSIAKTVTGRDITITVEKKGAKKTADAFDALANNHNIRFTD